MNKKQKNPLIELLASVQLAIFLLFLLASTSIIGTLIQQNNPAGFYVEQYGAKAARPCCHAVDAGWQVVNERDARQYFLMHWPWREVGAAGQQQ